MPYSQAWVGAGLSCALASIAVPAQNKSPVAININVIFFMFL
jgi:hypothetical protein